MLAVCLDMIENTNNMIIQTIKGDILKVSRNTSEYNVINIEDSFGGRMVMHPINRQSIWRYKIFNDLSSTRSDKVYEKAMLLGMAFKSPLERGHYDKLIITDKNNIIQGDISADTIYFIGDNDLDWDTTPKSVNKRIQIKCNTAIIDNICVYGYLVTSQTENIELVIKDKAIISHKFTSLNTVDETFCIFKEACGIDTQKDTYVGMHNIRKVLMVDLKKMEIKFNIDAHDVAVRMRHITLNEIDKIDFKNRHKYSVATLTALLQTILSMYESTNNCKEFKDIGHIVSTKLEKECWLLKTEDLRDRSKFILNWYKDTLAKAY